MEIERFLLDEWLELHQGAPYDIASSTGPAWSWGELAALLDPDERARLERLPLVYPPAKGTEELREAVANFHGVDPEEVLIVTGAAEGLHILFFLAAEAGANVVVPAPGFPGMRAVPRALGLEVREYRLRPELGNRIDLAEVATLLDRNSRLLLVNSPHNPTGAIVSDADMEALAALAAERGTTLVADEVYHPLGYTAESHTAARLPGVVVLGDLSKALSLSGLRIGWIVERDARRRELYLRTRMYFTVASTAPGELLGAAALRRREAVLARARQVAERNRADLQVFMRRNRERIDWVEPAGGTVCFPWLTFTTDSRPFCEALAARGVVTAPGDCFGAPRHLRIGFGGHRRFAEALPILEEMLHAAPIPA